MSAPPRRISTVPRRPRSVNDTPMSLRLPLRALTLVALGLIAGLSINIVRDESCRMWQTWTQVRIAYIVGTSLLFIFVSGLVCVWITNVQTFIVSAVLIMIGLGILVIKGESCGNPVFGQTDHETAKEAFTKACLASAAVDPPMSFWPSNYRIEACSCTAAKSLAAMSVADAQRIEARGYIDATEAQRLLVAPLTDCLSEMMTRYRNLTE